MERDSQAPVVLRVWSLVLGAILICVAAASLTRQLAAGTEWRDVEWTTIVIVLIGAAIAFLAGAFTAATSLASAYDRHKPLEEGDGPLFCDDIDGDGE